MSVAFPLGDRTFPRYFVASPTTHLLLWANGYSVPLSAAAPTCTVRRRKSRTVFSEEQLLLLEESFQRNHYLSTSERQSIAQKLCLSEQQVKTWFQNRRTKLRRSDPSALLDSRCVDSWKGPVYVTHILNNTLIILKLFCWSLQFYDLLYNSSCMYIYIIINCLVLGVLKWSFEKGQEYYIITLAFIPYTIQLTE